MTLLHDAPIADTDCDDDTDITDGSPYNKNGKYSKDSNDSDDIDTADHTSYNGEDFFETHFPQLATPKTRSLLGVAFGPSLGFLGICLFLAALNSLLSTGIKEIYHCIPISIALWLTSHLVPITISNITISFLPLLPAIGILYWVKILSRRACNNFSVTGDPRLVVLVATLSPAVITMILLGILYLMLEGFPLDVPSPFIAIFPVMGIHALGSIWGVASSHRGITLLLPMNLRAGKLAEDAKIAAKITGSIIRQWGVIFCFIVALLLILHWKQWVQLGGNNPLNMLPLWLLSISYLPNVMVFALGFSFMQTVHVGQAAINIATITTDNHLPAVPLMALLPHSTSAEWIIFPLGMIGYAIYCGVFCGMAISKFQSGYLPILLSSVFLTIFCSGLFFAATGEIGLLGSVGVSVVLGAIVCLAIFSIIGTTSALIYSYGVDISQLVKNRYLIYQEEHQIKKFGKENYASEIIPTQKLDLMFDFEDDSAIEYAREFSPLTGPLFIDEVEEQTAKSTSTVNPKNLAGKKNK